ncbi:MAG: addiction module protein [Gemmataceae bacterium]|nr:addiction module protein [Gemmataceae bacterium]
MSSTVEQVLQTALALSEADQFELLDALLARLEPGTGAPLDRLELDRRCTEIDAGEATLTPWEEVRDRVRQKYQSND